jgi:cell fate regulator YaaT (PSP1 superfamily)
MTTPFDSQEENQGRRGRHPRNETPQVRNTVVVVFGPVGRPLECDAGDFRLTEGQLVLVDDRRGGAFARVVVQSGRRACEGPLTRVLRVATESDQHAHKKRVVDEREALTFARQRGRELNLDLKMFRVELSPRGDRATVFFASEQRIDFRDLLRDLGAFLRVRVELRQVGVRDEAKIVGGIGSCGRELCCSTFLPKFEPISIRMAKSQNLALTPSKITGQCGRLKCCLVYEEAQYVEAAKGLPKIGKNVETPEGVGRVQDLDILRRRVRVFFPDQPPQVFSADQVTLAQAPAQEPRREAPREGSRETRNADRAGNNRNRPNRENQSESQQSAALNEATDAPGSAAESFAAEVTPAPETEHNDD